MDFLAHEFPSPYAPPMARPKLSGHIAASDMPSLARPSRETERYGGPVFFRTQEAVGRKKASRNTPPSGLVEFTAAAHEHVEPGFDVTLTPGAAQVPLAGSPFEVPPFGFIRHIVLVVTASGGVGGTMSADGPWNFFKEIALLDVNGAPIFGPLEGYQAYLANVAGAYAFRADPALHPEHSASPTAFKFYLRIPVEINHNNGLGALGNQNAAATYRIRAVVAPSTEIYSVAPGTIPSVRVQAFLEAWTQPTETDLIGRPQAQAPPRHGTTQYWSAQRIAVAAGQASHRVSRMGNLLRTLVLVGRTAAGVRSDTVLPAEIAINWDARELTREPLFLRRAYQSERYILGSTPAGVAVYPFSHDVLGHAGDGTAELWIPTVQATRFEISGNFGAPGSLEVLVNDVAPVEIDPADRWEEFSDTGFTPEVGTPVRTG